MNMPSRGLSGPAAEAAGRVDFAGSLLEIPGAEGLGAFRKELQDFFASELPQEISPRMLAGFHPRKADMQFWARRLQARGWSAPHWPVEYGGTGWSPLQRYVFEEESALAGAPPHGIQGLTLIGPVIYTFGSDAQKQLYLPKIQSGDEIWAQGFSEPDAGSDLASLRTSAVRAPGGWRINGRKIWTSDMHIADRLYCLVRTDSEVKPQMGLSILILPADAAGVTVRPIISIDGAHTLNEVIFDDVFAPDENLIGEAGKGWTYAKFLLANERAWAAELPRLKRGFARLVQLLAACPKGLGSISAEELGRVEAEIMALEALTLTALEQDEAGVEAPVGGSILKVMGSELQQRVGALQVRALGAAAAVFHSPYGEGVSEAEMTAGAGAVGDALFRRAASIYGGANELQRDLVARALLSS